jgi:hypothetical protein
MKEYCKQTQGRKRRVRLELQGYQLLQVLGKSKCGSLRHNRSQCNGKYADISKAGQSRGIALKHRCSYTPLRLSIGTLTRMVRIHSLTTRHNQISKVVPELTRKQLRKRRPRLHAPFHLETQGQGPVVPGLSQCSLSYHRSMVSSSLQPSPLQALETGSLARVQ